MPWFNVDDGFHCHPKVLAAGNAAMGLWTRCGSYCSRYATNGLVPVEIVKAYGSRTELARLLAVGWLTLEDDGYRMHDYLDYNRHADQIHADREKAAERKRRQRERDGHGVTSTVTPGVTNGVSHSPQAKPSQAKPTGITSVNAAAAVLLPPAAAAAMDLLIAHRLATEPDIRFPDRYAARIRSEETALHAEELLAASGLDDLDGEAIAERVLGLTRSQVITAAVHLERSQT
jgi:hypothetical protein